MTRIRRMIAPALLFIGFVVVGFSSAQKLTLTLMGGSNAQAVSALPAKPSQTKPIPEAGNPLEALPASEDPAMKPQISLSMAATEPAGNGLWVDIPASGVVGSNDTHVDPRAVLPDTKTLGVTSGGCVLGYGKPGQECIPPSKANCDVLRKQFVFGIPVTGADQLHLDKNGDKVACGIGD